MHKKEIYQMFFRGCYENITDFWDDLLDSGKPLLETKKAKRQALWPLFKKDVKLIGDFELNLATKFLLENNQAGLKKIKRSLEARKMEAEKAGRRIEMNKRFAKLFN